MIQQLVDIEVNDISMKRELIVRSEIISLKFQGKSFFSTILGYNAHWDYQHSNEHVIQKNTNLITIDKILIKCNGIDGSVVNGLRKPIILVLF